jgi:hypothetical protein
VVVEPIGPVADPIVASVGPGYDPVKSPKAEPLGVKDVGSAPVVTDVTRPFASVVMIG